MSQVKEKKKVSFIKGLQSEFRKIIWPSFPILMKQTFTVIVVALIIGAMVAGIDKIFGAVVRLILT